MKRERIFKKAPGLTQLAGLFLFASCQNRKLNIKCYEAFVKKIRDTISEGGKMGKVIDLPPRIKATAPPEASTLAPVDILQGFVGFEFPVEEIVPLFVNYGEVELYGYAVDKQKALRVLRRKSPDTADYIEKHPEIFPHPHLVFGENDCERVGFYGGGKEE